MMDRIEGFLLGDSLSDFFSGSLDEVSNANLHKRAWSEVGCELLDDSSALHEWPVPVKRARQQDARGSARAEPWEHGDSLDGHAFFEKNAAPSASRSAPFCPARPRADAMHVYEGAGATAGDVVPPLRDPARQKNISLFVRFAQLASRNGVTPLHLPSSDKFPTTLEMEAIVRAIVTA